MSRLTKEIAQRCCQQISWQDLDLKPIRSLIAQAMEEDLKGSGLREKPSITGDITSGLLPGDLSIQAMVRSREPLVLCGSPLAQELAQAYDSQLTFRPLAGDGERLAPGDPIGKLEGPIRSALAAERPLLNFLQRLSGISTNTRTYVDALAGSNTTLLDTRKTTPGYRYLEKYAVACGGGWNHRMGLFDRVMLKDNHLAAFGDNLMDALKRAVAASRKRHPELLVEMEVDRLDQVDAALAAKVDVILLDNFTIDELKAAHEKIGDRAVTEISGNVTLDTLDEIKQIGCDFVSTGALVHKSVWVDIGLDWD